jgi:molybdopterin converting factor small subunit
MDMKDMEIHLRLFGLGEQAAGRTDSTLHLSQGSTIGSLIEILHIEGSYLPTYLSFNPSTGFTLSKVEGLRTSFAQDRAEDRLLILINGRSVHLLQGLDTPLTDGDRVTIMPKTFGG